MNNRDLCCFTAIPILMLVCGCSAVRYKTVTITVRDDVTNAPIPGVNVSITTFGVIGKWNQGKVPSTQDGITDKKGEWKVMVPIGLAGFCHTFFSDSIGYQDKLVSFEEYTLDSGVLELMLKPINGRQGPK
jgi:hypothetical protein